MKGIITLAMVLLSSVAMAQFDDTSNHKYHGQYFPEGPGQLQLCSDKAKEIANLCK